MSDAFDFIGPPISLPGFDPAGDVLVIRLTEGPTEGAGDFTPDLTLHHDAAADRLVVRVALPGLVPGLAPGPVTVWLPGVRALDPAAVVVVDATGGDLPAPRRDQDTATLTGDGLYPTAGPAPGPGPLRFTHAHDWVRLGPPAERFFDLSDPATELAVTLADSGGSEGGSGAIYAIRFTETSHSPGAIEAHRSIVLAQTAPGVARLAPGALTEWFAARLGSPSFRAIAWIWLGHEGRYTDPATGAAHGFGRINRRPRLSVTGPITATLAIRR